MIGKRNAGVLLQKCVLGDRVAPFAALLLCLSVGVPALWNHVSGSLIRDLGEGVSYLGDWPAFLGMGVLGIPLMALFTLYYCREMPRRLERIFGDWSGRPGESSPKELMVRYSGLCDHIIPAVVIPIVALLANSAWLYSHLFTEAWGPPHWFAVGVGDARHLKPVGVYYLGLVTCYNYLMLYLVYYASVGAWLMRSMSLFAEVEVAPGHPDRTGGLSALGEALELNTRFLMFVGVLLGILIFLGPDARPVELDALIVGGALLLMLVYIAAWFVLTIIPAVGFRGAMKEAREEALADLDRTIRNLSARRRNSHSGVSALEELQTLRLEYQAAKEMRLTPLTGQDQLRGLGVQAAAFLVGLFTAVAQYLLLPKG